MDGIPRESWLSAARNRSHPARSEDGFTLIELLIVILILGILAAIAVPSFLSQRDRAHDTDAMAGAATARAAIETYAIDHQGNFTGANTTILLVYEPTLVEYDLTVNIPAPRAYDVAVRSESGVTFGFSQISATEFARFCDSPGTRACRDDGTW